MVGGEMYKAGGGRGRRVGGVSDHTLHRNYCNIPAGEWCVASVSRGGAAGVVASQLLGLVPNTGNLANNKRQPTNSNVHPMSTTAFSVGNSHKTVCFEQLGDLIDGTVLVSTVPVGVSVRVEAIAGRLMPWVPPTPLVDTLHNGVENSCRLALSMNASAPLRVARTAPDLLAMPLPLPPPPLLPRRYQRRRVGEARLTTNIPAYSRTPTSPFQMSILRFAVVAATTAPPDVDIEQQRPPPFCGNVLVVVVTVAFTEPLLAVATAFPLLAAAPRRGLQVVR